MNTLMYLVDLVDWRGRHEDSCGSARLRETPQERSDEEAPGLPAESEVPRAQINIQIKQLRFI
jgi:hypothetical protein